MASKPAEHSNVHQGSCESTLYLDTDGLDGILVVTENPPAESLQPEGTMIPQPSKAIGGRAKKMLIGGTLIVIFVLFSICFFLFQTNQQNPEYKADQAPIATSIVSPSSLPESSNETVDHQVQPQHPTEVRTEIPGKPIESPGPSSDKDIIESRSINIKETDPHSLSMDKKTALGLLTDPKPGNQTTSEPIDSLVAQTVEAGAPTVQAIESDNPDLESQLSESSEVPKIAPVVTSELEFPVRFSFGSSRLKPVSKQHRASINDFLARCGDELHVVGQTCNIGDKAYNRILGMARAKAVKRFLVNKAEFSGSYQMLSEGVDNPDLRNSTRQERAQNRRVVLRCFAR